jgi:hypothetical protein
MRCKCGHLHPPRPITAATKNPTQPWGPRPFHCSECREVTKRGVVGENWRSYLTVASAKQAGHERSCAVCFEDGQ